MMVIVLYKPSLKFSSKIASHNSNRACLVAEQVPAEDIVMEMTAFVQIEVVLPALDMM